MNATHRPVSTAAVTVTLGDQGLHSAPSLNRTHSMSAPVPLTYVVCASFVALTLLAALPICIWLLSRKCPPPVPLFQKSYWVIASPKGSLALNRLDTAKL